LATSGEANYSGSSQLLLRPIEAEIRLFRGREFIDGVGNKAKNSDISLAHMEYSAGMRNGFPRYSEGWAEIPEVSGLWQEVRSQDVGYGRGSYATVDNPVMSTQRPESVSLGDRVTSEINGFCA
jgi:hypothetical protein